MADKLRASIVRHSQGTFSFIIEEDLGMARIDVPLLPVSGGFVPLFKARAYGNITTVQWIAGGEMLVQYDDGDEAYTMRMGGSVWSLDAPLPPLPTIAAIANKEQLINTSKFYGIDYTVTGQHFWYIEKPTQLARVSVGSGELRVDTSATPGDFPVTITLQDQWGRKVSASFRVYVPRLPTINGFPDITIDLGATQAHRIIWTMDVRSGSYSLEVASGDTSIVSASASGSGFATNLMLTASAGKPGAASIWMTARDKWGQAASAQTRVIVRNPAPPWRWPFRDVDRTPGRTWMNPAGHNGIDFGYGIAQNGAPVHCAGPGTVRAAGWEAGGWGGGGNMVVVDHHDGTETGYAHMSAIHVGVGQSVDTNSVLGLVGNTGNSQGAHLHFQCQPLGGFNTVDPMGYMAARGAIGW